MTLEQVREELAKRIKVAQAGTKATDPTDRAFASGHATGLEDAIKMLDKVLKSQSKDLEEDRRKNRERQARWRARNPDRKRAIDKRYQDKHREYIRERNKLAERARRARMRKAR